MGYGTPCNASELTRKRREHGSDNVELRREGSMFRLYIRDEKQDTLYGSDGSQPCRDCYGCSREGFGLTTWADRPEYRT